ncbi:MAG: flagellar hook-associated protein FlgL [Desulfosporosinus sp.]|nr:flagellar hook-associated protein FlgL [Desulfosporosinus sp.]
MRITNNMISQNLLRNLETSQEKIQQLQDQVSSGQKINKPSDDPIGISNVMRLNNSISSVAQYSSSAGAALDTMNATDSTLGDITSMLQSVKDLAVQGADGTQTADDRTTIAAQVDQLAAQLKISANTQIGSKYIFSGTATDTETIAADGTFQGNNQDVNLTMGNNVSIPISVNGQTLFGDSTTGVFATLNNLSTALKANDTTAIEATLNDLDTNINNVINQRAELGGSVNRVTALQSQLDSTTANLKQSLSDVQSSDIAQTYTDFTAQQTTYKAALSVGSQILQLSLVDYMK